MKIGKINITFVWPAPDHLIHFFAGMSIMAITGSWILVAIAALGREAYNIFYQKKKDYMVTSIPRYVLIGKDGLILDANAPGPASGILLEVLQEASASRIQ
jgi:hypothetical protein